MNDWTRPSDEPVVDIGKTKQALHDLLIDLDTEHSGDCPYCTATAQDGGDPVTISEDDVKAAVTKAVDDATAPLTARIAELEGAATAADTDKAVAQLQSELDAAVVNEKAARDALAAQTSYLEGEAAVKAAADEAESRKAERVDAVKALAIFDEPALAQRADRWAAQDADVWASTFADYEDLAKKVVATTSETTVDPATAKADAPVASAMTGRATDAETDQSTKSPFADVLANRQTVAGLF